ncbi:hypothetical protein DEU56DRAFT_822852 [Suillus clintonianus]|uniref:uncharacterized protein n=1 Tax=Suillus clintonianus TaxID=1904413 RepID=UPI001B8793AD|nr:uncharacterized protein DEU56DRAFT_822852 [Suillus clintonianus]KAG2126204.1 hypothetical protein DEU56DRAFT_822852 [Suillus clintonianus]
MKEYGLNYTLWPLVLHHWRKLFSSALLLLLSSSALSIYSTSGAIFGSSGSLFTLCMPLSSSTWRLRMQLLSGKL